MATVINNEYYVSLEIAKLLKEARFDWRVRYMYRNNNPTLCICTERTYRNTPKPNKCPMYWQYAAPTLEVAQRWLREVKNIHIEITFGGKWIYTPYNLTNLECLLSKDEFPETRNYNTYEEALEAGINKALEIILENGE